MWNPYKACDALCIPYKVYDWEEKEIGGYSNPKDRFLHIRKSEENNMRVWAHEIAHTLLHFQMTKEANDYVERSIIEAQADTVAYIVCSVLGNEDRAIYKQYLTAFIGQLPLAMQKGSLLDADFKKLKQTAIVILNAGGYYG